MRRRGTGGSICYAYIWDVQVKQTTVVVLLLLLALQPALLATLQSSSSAEV